MPVLGNNNMGKKRRRKKKGGETEREVWFRGKAGQVGRQGPPWFWDLV